jgi:hypothetical protein
VEIEKHLSDEFLQVDHHWEDFKLDEEFQREISLNQEVNLQENKSTSNERQLRNFTYKKEISNFINLTFVDDEKLNTSIERIKNKLTFNEDSLTLPRLSDFKRNKVVLLNWMRFIHKVVFESVNSMESYSGKKLLDWIINEFNLKKGISPKITK